MVPREPLSKPITIPALKTKVKIVIVTPKEKGLDNFDPTVDNI